MAGTTVLEVLIKARDDTANAMNSVQGRMKALGKTARTAGLAVTAGVTLPLLGAGFAAVSAASDLLEAENKTKVVFGSAAKAIENFAMTSADNWGISQRAALEYAGSIGVIFRGSGFAEEASADLSLSIVKLAADLGSINNIPYDVALDKLKSGLVGQSRPLRDIGVLLNETDVALHAVTIGLAEEGEELVEAQKLLARFSLIQEKTALQQGDFARTSDDLANAQKRLGARFEDLRASIGQALLPVALKLVTWGNQMVTVGERLNATFQVLSPRMKIIVGVLLLIAIAFGPMLILFGTFLIMLPFMISGAIAFGGALMLLLTPIGLTILGIIALIAIGVLVVIFWDDIVAGAERFGSIMQSLPGLVGKGLLAMVKATLAAMGAMGRAMIQTAINIVEAIIDILSFWKHFGSTMKQVYARQGAEAGEAMLDAMMSAMTRQTDAVVAIMREPLTRLREIVRSLGAELQRLAGLATVESSAEDIRLAELRLEVLQLEAAAAKEKAEREAEVARIDDIVMDKEDQLANIRKHLTFVTGDLRIELLNMERALVKEIDQLEDQREAVEASLGPAEKAIAAKEAEIRELEHLQDLRRAERDLVVATSAAKDATLPTDAAVLISLKNMGDRIEIVTDAIDAQASHLMTVYIPAWQDAETVAMDAAEETATSVGEDLDDMMSDFDAASADLSEFGIEFDDEMGAIAESFEDMAFTIEFDLKAMTRSFFIEIAHWEIAVGKFVSNTAQNLDELLIDVALWGVKLWLTFERAWIDIRLSSVGWVLDLLASITSWLGSAFFITNLWQLGWNAGRSFLNGILSGAGGIIGGIVGLGESAIGLIPGVDKQTGGVVPGAHGQPVPIIAHGGETVLTQSQSDSLMRALGGDGSTSSNARSGAQYITINHLTVQVTDGDLRTVLRGIGVNL